MLLAKPPYPTKFQPGDVAIAIELVRFIDGTRHNAGQELVVTKDNVHYYNVCQVNYHKKQIRP